MIYGRKMAKNRQKMIFSKKKFWNREFLVKVICMQNFSFIQQLFWILRGVCWYSTPPGNSGPFWGSGKLGLMVWDTSKNHGLSTQWVG